MSVFSNCLEFATLSERSFGGSRWEDRRYNIFFKCANKTCIYGKNVVILQAKLFDNGYFSYSASV